MAKYTQTRDDLTNMLTGMSQGELILILVKGMLRNDPDMKNFLWRLRMEENVRREMLLFKKRHPQYDGLYTTEITWHETTEEPGAAGKSLWRTLEGRPDIEIWNYADDVMTPQAKKLAEELWKEVPFEEIREYSVEVYKGEKKLETSAEEPEDVLR